MASEIEQKIMPFSAKVSRKVVATETESITISTATPANFFCSSIEIPNLLNVSNNSIDFIYGETSVIVGEMNYICTKIRKRLFIHD